MDSAAGLTVSRARAPVPGKTSDPRPAAAAMAATARRRSVRDMYGVVVTSPLVTRLLGAPPAARRDGDRREVPRGPVGASGRVSTGGPGRAGWGRPCP